MNSSIIAISYAKRTLVPGSRERERMLLYAKEFTQFHIIVFTRQSEGFPAVQHDGNVTLYATNATSKVAMLARAFSLGKKILASGTSDSYIVSSQDPFESSLIGRMLTYQTQSTHLVQIHGDVFNPASYRGSLLQWLRVQYGKRVVRNTKKIRVVSHRIQQSLLKLGVSKNCITVLPIQADLRSFFTVGEQRTPQEGGHLSLLYVGRLAPEKNIPLLLAACAQVKVQSGMQFTLKIIGDGLEKTSLQQQAIDLGIKANVVFAGWTESIADEMAQADVLCLSSNHEGFAMVLQEAAAARMAIVTTDVGCAGDLLVHNEEVLIVAVDNQNAYANCLLQLQDERLRNQLAQAAYEKVCNEAITQEEYIRRFVASHK